MIKLIVALIVFIIYILSATQSLLLGSYLFNKNVYVSNAIKDITSNLLPYFYTHSLNSNILYDGLYNKSNKIDIVICNHINPFDFIICDAIIKLFDEKPLYIMYKKQIVLIPGVGFLLDSNYDIKLNRKLEDDIDNINEKISKIEEGIIIMMPEGTRCSSDKIQKSQKYCHENNLKVYNNILYPKMKGLYLITNILKKNGKLGNIIDLTIQIENLININEFTKILFVKNIGRTFCLINSYNVPHNIDNYDIFKKWFISEVWNKKDLLLDTIQNTQIHEYKEFVPKIKDYNYFILIVLIILFIYLLTHMNGIFIPISMVLSYYITYTNY